MFIYLLEMGACVGYILFFSEFSKEFIKEARIPNFPAFFEVLISLLFVLPFLFTSY